jgi:3-methylcrotonyl-CoA carboxylase alpha subunit
MISPTGLFGLRLNAARSPARLDMTVDGERHVALARPTDATDDWQWDIAIDDRTDLSAASLPTTHGPLAEVQPNGPIRIFENGFCYEIGFGNDYGTAADLAATGAILAPMPGRIIAVDVTPGDAVTKGQKLVTLEAMKMEHSLTAPFDGIVTELHATTGAQVQVEALLARIEPHPSP